jgi:NADH-quinone oxidoreductase subunit C
MNSSDLAEQLCEKFPDLLGDPVEFRGEITLQLVDAQRIEEVCRYAKQSLGFDFLLDIASVDNYGEDPRWTMVYELSGIDNGCLLRLKTRVSEEVSELPSVSAVWSTANWHEREVFDMMGIRFTGHPDLRRILMWEGYPYHPLRKDFPLAGKPSETLDVAFSRAAPLEGGPFVTTPGTQESACREPRSREQQGQS